MNILIGGCHCRLDVQWVGCRYQVLAMHLHAKTLIEDEFLDDLITLKLLTRNIQNIHTDITYKTYRQT